MKKYTILKKAFLLLCICFFGINAFAQRAGHIDGFKSTTKKQHPKSIQQTTLLNSYDIKFYHLDIAVERTSVDVEGRVSILAEVLTSQLDTFAFELIDALGIDSVLINGNNSSFTRSNDEVFVEVLPALTQGSFIEAQIFYGGTPVSGGFFSGISNAFSQSWGNQVTWTLSEPFNAKQWFPCKQVLSDKADSVYVFVTTSNQNKVGSNGVLENVVALPNNKVRYEWKSRYPINYYLISIAVGEYVDYSFYAHPAGLNDSILIQNYIYDNPATLPYFKTQIDLTGDFIELFSDLFGLYPFWQEKYGHSMAPLNGGMEHQTMTTQGFFNFTLTAHELAHQWFGNNVTCATWSDIWINEGFASYSEYIALENLNPGQQFPWISDCHNLIVSEPGGSVFIPVNQANDESRIFNYRLSYKKGAAIVHMLRFELQDDNLFFNILKAFQIQFKDSVATGMDFKNLAASMSGKNLDDFFDQWYFGEGHPIYNIVWFQGNNTLHISSTQTPSTSNAGVFKMLLPFKIYTLTGDTTILLQQNNASENFSVPFSAPIDSIRFDPEKRQLKVISNLVQEVRQADIKGDNFLLYPNPVHESVYVQFGQPEARHISIYNTEGRLMYQAQSNLSGISIPVGNLSAGLYFVKINGQSKTYHTKKFIKTE